MIVHGETSVESQDHEVYGKVAAGRGEVRDLFMSSFRPDKQVDIRELV